MQNIIAHARAFHYPFEERPFNAVDSLVLSQLAYLRFEQCGLQKQKRYLQLGSLAGETHNQALLYNVPASKSSLFELMRAVAASPRYRWLCATEYESHIDAEINKQFSAITYLFEDGAAYIAFSGTDTSVIGWKENFTMLYEEATPSQRAAAAYLRTAAQRFPGPLYIGGHSKGGNMAVFAAVSAEPAIQERIVSVFNHDGPGFPRDFFTQDAYQRMKNRIHKMVPEMAIVGMLFQDQENFRVVKSTGLDIFQHDMFSWVVKDGELSFAENIDKSSQQAISNLNAWIDSLSMEQRKTIVEALFRIIATTDAEHVGSLLLGALWNAPAVTKVISGFPPETKGLFYGMFKSLDALLRESEPGYSR